MKRLNCNDHDPFNPPFSRIQQYAHRIWAFLFDKGLFVLFERLSRRPWLAVLFIGFLSFVGSGAVSMVRGYRLPQVHDEFCYLLMADTFASGRVTNPTHPLWEYFESFYVIHKPTYCIKFPPAQGLFLAMGQVLGAHPAVGVWISVGLMCAAICWMLQAWLPPPWALLGSFLATLQIGIGGYWAQTYWGGAVAALGGALLYGGLRRVYETPRFAHGIVMGLGVAILANSRPFEGLLISLSAMGVFLYAFLGRAKPSSREIFLKAAVPAAIILTFTGMAMGYYNWRCTGHVMRMPYQVHEETYSIAPQIMWQKTRSVPSYRHHELENHYKSYLTRHNNMHDIEKFSIMSKRRLIRIIQYYISPALLFVLVLLPVIASDRWMLLAMLNCAGLVVFTMFTQGGWQHYSAPMTALLFAVLTQGLRLFRLVKIREKIVGKCLVGFIVLTCIAGAAIRIAHDLRDEQGGFPKQRLEVIQKLEAKDGGHLVIVRYGPNHSVHQEWVYNRADIDGSRIVWARDMGCTLSQKLIEYFHDRHLWLLHVDDEMSKPQLLPLKTNGDLCVTKTS